ncbi:hypothetical protein Tco_0875879 [Tanacetum coccineum]|uniref:Zinc finger, CCHC-type n=1 Tax=Tanacetum coccineum TaxID=301880 RepID=A0ABQ5BTQ9_9ASTR
MASMNTRLNIKKLDGNILQKHGGSKQVGFKQLGPCVEIRVHGEHDEKCVWFEVELQGAQGDHEAEVFQVSNDDTAMAQRRLYGLSKIFWAEDTTRSTYLVNRSPSSSIEFNKPIDMLGFFGWLASIKQGMLEPVKIKCIFLEYHKSIVGNKLWRLDDVTSKVVLYRNMGFNESGEYKKTFIGSGNVDQRASLQEVQTQDLMDYQLARDREQHLACELFGYREDNNEAAFAVAAVEKIYAHESLTFNNTISCEVISKWKAGLKDDMDARSDVYVLSNGCRKCSDDSDGYYWEYTPAKGNVLGMEIIRSQEYQMVCTRLDIASADVGSLKANLHYMEALSTTKAGYVTFTEAWKKEIWLKGLLTKSRYELRVVAGIATGALVKGGSLSEVLAQVEVATYRY